MTDPVSALVALIDHVANCAAELAVNEERGSNEAIAASVKNLADAKAEAATAISTLQGERDAAVAEHQLAAQSVASEHGTRIAAERALAEAMKALEGAVSYSTHKSGCGWRHGHDCDCGLDELRARSRMEPGK